MVQIKDNDANFSKFEIQSTRAERLRPVAFSPDPQSQSDGAIRQKWSEWVLCFHADANIVSQMQAFNKWTTDETERLAFTARHPAIARRITIYTEAMPAAIALDIEAAADGADRTTQLYASLINHLQTDLNDNAQPSGNCEQLDQMLHDQWAGTRHRLGPCPRPRRGYAVLLSGTTESDEAASGLVVVTSVRGNSLPLGETLPLRSAADCVPGRDGVTASSRRQHRSRSPPRACVLAGASAVSASRRLLGKEA